MVTRHCSVGILPSMTIRNKTDAIALLAVKLMDFRHDWKRGLIEGDRKDMELEEMQFLADEWDIPFCWELHNRVMGQFVNHTASKQWIDSGCHLLQ